MRAYIICLLFFCLESTSTLHAQNDIILQDVIVGNATVSAPGSVTLKPGFHAVSGCSFHAYISPLQPQDSSIIIDPSEGSSIPVEGSSDNNFITAITYREAKLSVPSVAFRHIEEIQYFDGLGRPSQKILVGASPEGNDIIQPFFYDSFGREAIKPLPYTNGKTGLFRTGVTVTTVNDYYSSPTLLGKEPDSRAYDSTGFDNSPLNRVTSRTGPGVAWENKPVTVNYLSNTATDSTWSVTGDYSYSSFSYPVNSLYITETIDEEGNTSREYKDKLGQVVLSESKLGNEWLRTAYIYDDFGLLRCVVPPEASDPNTEIGLCYYYKYDERNRLIEKKIPGGGIVKIVYDKRDRLRCTQNANQSLINEWSFTKYDDLNRPVVTGTVEYSGDVGTAIEADSLNEFRNNTSDNFGYSSNSFPKSNTPSTCILAATYYDNYDFIAGMNLNDSLNSDNYDVGDYNFASISDMTPVGQITGSMLKVLSSSEDNGVIPLPTLYTTFFYDKYGHLLRSISENHLKGKDIVSNIYEDITYLVLQSKQLHYKGAEQIIIEKWFEYDHTGRLLATREKINSQPEITLNAMVYNEVGELIMKYLHSNQTSGDRTFAQKIDYQYNIRGWLTKINDPALDEGNELFGMQLFYSSTSGLGSPPITGLYNGNIVGIKWGIKNDIIRGYKFTYDNLNRMLQANYAEGSEMDSNTGYNSETITGYDKNGNILGLQRKCDNTIVDSLTYNYFTKTNQINAINDNGTSTTIIDDYPDDSNPYTYDANGNMTMDGAKNITTEYFHTLNLPQDLDFGNYNRIFYHYTATGIKLMKHTTVLQPVTDIKIHYIGNIVYEGGTLSYILTDEGRLMPYYNGSGRFFKYEYSIKDHLGNSRVTFLDTDLGGSVDVVQTNSYYPFGLVMSQTNTPADYKKNKYLYNGKELQDESLGGVNLDWYAYGARYYDPQIGRWITVDPAAEQYFQISTYTYVANNPLIFVDFDGKEIKLAGGILAQTASAITLMKIAATTKGAQRINSLISNGKIFTIERHLFMTGNHNKHYNNYYDPGNGTAFFSLNGLNYLLKGDGGSTSPTSRLGHEINHMYDLRNYPFMFAEEVARSTKRTGEYDAVDFANYLESVYGSSKFRDKYKFSPGDIMSVSTTNVNSEKESISNFTILNMDLNNLYSNDLLSPDHPLEASFEKKVGDNENQTNYLRLYIDENNKIKINYYNSYEEFLNR